jgi:hypothetical protein
MLPKSLQISCEEVEPMAGIEPATDGLRNRCSTTELHWLPTTYAKVCAPCVCPKILTVDTEQL